MKKMKNFQNIFVIIMLLLFVLIFATVNEIFFKYLFLAIFLLLPIFLLTAIIFFLKFVYNYLNKKEILKNIPRQNYHLLGYSTFIYLCFILFTALLGWRIDYGYYEVLRWTVTCFSAWTAIRIHKNEVSIGSIWVLVFSAVAILFNPIIKIPFEKDVWLIFDIITALLFFVYAVKTKKTTSV